MKKSAMVSLRLDSQTRYLAGLAAKKQHTTLTEFINRAIEKALHSVPITPGLGSIYDYSNWLYDLNPITRFVRLASAFDDLLDREEMLIWRVIEGNKYFWKKGPWMIPIILGKSTPPDERIPDPVTRDVAPDLEKIQQHWDKIVAVAREEASPDVLPTDGKPDPRKTRRSRKQRKGK